MSMILEPIEWHYIVLISGYIWYGYVYQYLQLSLLSLELNYLVNKINKWKQDLIVEQVQRFVLQPLS